MQVNSTKLSSGPAPRESPLGITLEQYSNHIKSRCATDPVLRVLFEQLSVADRRDDRAGRAEVGLLLSFIQRWEASTARRDARGDAR